jgi:hypothetical protein
MSRFKQYLHIIQEMKNVLDNYDYDDDKIEIKIEEDTDTKEDTNTKKDTLKENIITLFFKKDKNYKSSGNWIDFIKSKEIETKLNNLSIDIKLTEKISKYIIKYKEIDIKEQLLNLKNNFVITITLLIFIGKEELIKKFENSNRKSYDMFTQFDENKNYIYLKTDNNDFLIITFESSDLEQFYCVYFDNNGNFREGESSQYEESNYQEKAYEDLLSQIINDDDKNIIKENKEKILKLNPIRMN